MLEQDGEGWERLFAEPNFVVAHGKYLSIEIYVRGLEAHRHARQPVSPSPRPEP